MLLRGDFKLAAEMYRLASSKQQSMDLRLKCLRMYAIESCDYDGDPDEVLKLIEQWKQKIDAHNEQQNHALWTITAYAAVAKGDGKLAHEAAKAAGMRRPQSFNEMEIHQGVLARNIETYIRTREEITRRPGT